MSHEIVHVDIEGAAYDVVIGPDALVGAGERIRAVAGGKRVALVSDTQVADLFGARVSAELASAGFDVFPLAVAAGEKSKRWDVAGQLLEAFAQVGLDRTDLVVALGGGVVGDLAGFAAAIYLRGVGFVQIPTTLLAQVDSSVGGKTGVDLSAGKNLVGSFKQPGLVLADTGSLGSLPAQEWASGLAEVVKSAAISGEGFLGWLEESEGALLGRDLSVTADTVRRCVEFKSKVVRSDVREEGVRECLNYGHTLGHAIENVAGYGVIPHGIAVAEGMRFASRLAVEASSTDLGFVRRQDRLLDSIGLPTLKEAFDPELILGAMHADKKARGGKVRFVLVDGPGLWRCEAIEDAMIREHLDAWVASKERD